jgi:hypothetical protein
MESTFIPLELVFEHRNYLPSLGILMPFFYYFLLAGKPQEYTKSRWFIISLFILIFALQTHFRAWQWSDNVKLYLSDVQFHPGSARANYEVGKVFGQRLEQGKGDPQENYQYAIKHFDRVTSFLVYLRQLSRTREPMLITSHFYMPYMQNTAIR